MCMFVCVFVLGVSRGNTVVALWLGELAVCATIFLPTRTEHQVNLSGALLEGETGEALTGVPECLDHSGSLVILLSCACAFVSFFASVAVVNTLFRLISAPWCLSVCFARRFFQAMYSAKLAPLLAAPSEISEMSLLAEGGEEFLDDEGEPRGKVSLVAARIPVFIFLWRSRERRVRDGCDATCAPVAHAVGVSCLLCLSESGGGRRADGRCPKSTDGEDRLQFRFWCEH